jgi:hypothetical protein
VTSIATGSGQSRDILPEGFWSADAVRAVLDKTMTVRLAPDLSGLTEAESETVQRLVAAGRVIDDIYQDQFHHQALAARADLLARHDALGRPQRTRDLLELNWGSQAPIATTLDNERLPFLPVDDERPGKNLYPLDVPREALEEYLDRRPDERSELLHPYTVVRRTTKAAVRRDLAVLRRHPALAVLHPRLAPRWNAALADPTLRPFYAVPYSVAWADQLTEVYGHLILAADEIRVDDPDFSDFLRLRARDLLANDYEGGDAAWVRGRSGRLNAVIGPYESYEDNLFGAKGFFGLRIMLRDESRSQAQLAALIHLQSIEDALPIDRHKAARTDIPIGVYDIVADFGHQRYGPADAAILPNDGELVRKYGRTIMMSRNLMTHPDSTARRQRKWRAVMAPAHHDDLTADGHFNEVVWHEIGHYLGPEEQADGRRFDDALEDTADLIEELKAELVSCFAAPRLRRAGYFEEEQVKQVRSVAMASVLRPTRPRPSQQYETLWLMEANFFLDRRVLDLDGGRVTIRYERVDDAVEAMLREVLEIQSQGTRATAEAFINRYSTWDERHESIAAAVRAAEGPRFLRTSYGVLEADD